MQIFKFVFFAYPFILLGIRVLSEYFGISLFIECLNSLIVLIIINLYMSYKFKQIDKSFKLK